MTVFDVINQMSTSTKISWCIGSIIGIVSMWAIFEKAGEAGWQSIIPIWNTVVLFKILYGNGAKMLLIFVPILNVVLAICIFFRLAECFGKSKLYALGLLFLSPIFMPILAFDSSSYEGPCYSFI